MPIRLNLLAELHAAEDLRRRDPVKRVIWIGAFLATALLVWWASLEVKAIVYKRQISQVEANIASRTNEYRVVVDGQKQAMDAMSKLNAIQQFATNRLLNGNLLNALQQTTVDGVRLMHFKVEQSYSVTEEVKSRTSGNRVIPGRPGTVTEHITLTVDAKDSSANPGDLMIAKFREVIATNDYFRAALGKTNEVRLTRYSPPQSLPDEQPFVLFTVQCVLPDKTR